MIKIFIACLISAICVTSCKGCFSWGTKTVKIEDENTKEELIHVENGIK